MKYDIHSKPERIVWRPGGGGGYEPGLQVPGTQMAQGRTLGNWLESTQIIEKLVSYWHH